MRQVRIVHRDVKPANIMLDKQGRVHLMDFGLASRQEEAARLTNDGAVMGTPAYMAPEQAAGQKGEVQPATDQYAAGVVLYELLTGTVPFTGPLSVVIHNVIHTNPEPPRHFRPAVPKDLETICLKAMAKRPEDRYVNCQELADDLRRWLEGEPVTARPLRPWERLTRWVKKEPKLAAAVAVVSAVLITSIVVVSAFARSASAARDEAVKALAEEWRYVQSLCDFPKRMPTSQFRGNNRFNVNPPPAGRVLAICFPSDMTQLLAVIDDLNGKAWFWDSKVSNVNFPLNGDKRLLNLNKAAFSSDGSRVVTLDNQGWVRVWDVKNRQFLFQLDSKTPAMRSAAISPDGTHISTLDASRNLGVWNAKTGGPALLSIKSNAKGWNEALAFSPDGNRIATADREGVHVWDIKSGEKRCTANEKGFLFSAQFSADGKRLLTTGSMGERVWNAESGAELITLKLASHQTWSATFSPDGSRIATIAADCRLRVFDAENGTELLNFYYPSQFNSRLSSVAWSPDGVGLAVGLSDGTIEVREAGLPQPDPKP